MHRWTAIFFPTIQISIFKQDIAKLRYNKICYINKFGKSPFLIFLIQGLHFSPCKAIWCRVITFLICWYGNKLFESGLSCRLLVLSRTVMYRIVVSCIVSWALYRAVYRIVGKCIVAAQLINNQQTCCSLPCRLHVGWRFRKPPFPDGKTYA